MIKFLKLKGGEVKLYYQNGARNAPFLSFLHTLKLVSQTENFVIFKVLEPDTSGLKINIKEVK